MPNLMFKPDSQCRCYTSGLLLFVYLTLCYLLNTCERRDQPIAGRRVISNDILPIITDHLPHGLDPVIDSLSPTEFIVMSVDELHSRWIRDFDDNALTHRTVANCCGLILD